MAASAASLSYIGVCEINVAYRSVAAYLNMAHQCGIMVYCSGVTSSVNIIATSSSTLARPTAILRAARGARYWQQRLKPAKHGLRRAAPVISTNASGGALAITNMSRKQSGDIMYQRATRISWRSGIGGVRAKEGVAKSAAASSAAYGVALALTGSTGPAISFWRLTPCSALLCRNSAATKT